MQTQTDHSHESDVLRPLTAGEYARLCKLIHHESGIHLGASRQRMLERRLQSRLSSLGIDSFGDYYLHVADAQNRRELQQMIDCICTNETRFFREPRQFAYLEHEVFPEWLRLAAEGSRPRTIRAWSAACSTGEEPYSLAMLLRAHFPAHLGWELEIQATDLSTRALEQARTAVWPIERANEIPERFLKTFCLRGRRTQDGKLKIGDEIRRIVHFRHFNLTEPTLPFNQQFDLVFCRNVLIYFNRATKDAVIDRMLRALAPRGLLLVGHAESLVSITDRVQSVAPTIYEATPVAAERRRAR